MYSKERNNKNQYPRHKRELRFMYEQALKKNFLQYQPRIFYLSNGTKYTPDFYSPKLNTYYELVGTRQAYHSNKEKIALFIMEYPEIKFEIVTVRRERINAFDKYKDTPIEKYLKENKLTKRQFCKKHNICPTTLDNIIARPAVTYKNMITCKKIENVTGVRFKYGIYDEIESIRMAARQKIANEEQNLHTLCLNTGITCPSMYRFILGKNGMQKKNLLKLKNFLTHCHGNHCIIPQPNKFQRNTAIYSVSGGRQIHA